MDDHLSERSGATAAAHDPRTGYLRVLSVPEFRALFAAEVLSVLALVAVQITLSVLVYDRTGSPLLSSLAFALGFLPHLLGASLLSSAADRLPARTAMATAQTAGAAAIGCMAIPGTPVPVMLLLLAVTGTVAPVHAGARSGALADVLDAAGFPLGRSLMRMAAQTAQIAGFSFGGALMLLVSPAGALVIAALTMGASALVVLVRTQRRPARERAAGGLVGASLSGVRDALRLPRLRRVLLLTWIPPALMVWPEALANPLADSMGGGPMAVALLLTAAPVGTVAGELLAGALLTDAQRRRFLVPLALAVFAPFPLFLAQPGPVAAAALLAAGALGFGYTLALDAVLLEAAPEQARGRVFALQSAGLMITQGAGFALAGAVAEAVPAHLAVAGAGVGGAAVVLALGRRRR